MGKRHAEYRKAQNENKPWWVKIIEFPFIFSLFLFITIFASIGYICERLINFFSGNGWTGMRFW